MDYRVQFPALVGFDPAAAGIVCARAPVDIDDLMPLVIKNNVRQVHHFVCPAFRTTPSAELRRCPSSMSGTDEPLRLIVAAFNGTKPGDGCEISSFTPASAASARRSYACSIVICPA